MCIRDRVVDSALKSEDVFVIMQFSCGKSCLLYTSDAADDTPCVDLGGRRIIKKDHLVNNYYCLLYTS
ncbi:hypothetical protein, partial [Staphylococcus aureus]